MSSEPHKPDILQEGRKKCYVYQRIFEITKLKENNVRYMCKLQLCCHNYYCNEDKQFFLLLRFIGSPESSSAVKGATSWPLAINYLNFIPFELLLFTQERQLWVLSEAVNCLPDLRKISLYFSLIQHSLSIIIRLAPLYCRSSLNSEAGIKLIIPWGKAYNKLTEGVLSVHCPLSIGLSNILQNSCLFPRKFGRTKSTIHQYSWRLFCKG